ILLFAFVHALAEALDGQANVFADVAQALGAEHQRDDHQHDQPMPDAESTHDGSPRKLRCGPPLCRVRAAATVPVVRMAAATDPHPCGVVYSSSRSRKSTIESGTLATPPSKT